MFVCVCVRARVCVCACLFVFVGVWVCWCVFVCTVINMRMGAADVNQHDGVHITYISIHIHVFLDDGIAGCG